MTRATSGPMSPTPFAFFDPESWSVRTWQLTLDGGSTPFSGRLPKWGSMRNGALYGRPTPAPLTAGRGSGSLLATPHANASTGPGTQGRDGGLNLQTQVALLPTPRATDGPKGGPGQRNGRGVADSLPAIGALLPTPTAQAAKHGSTPDVNAHGYGSNLWDIPHHDFGPYTAAVQRWELVLGRPAPPPTIDVDGKPRLNPQFVEFMMGLHSGWVTGLEGVSRSAALKMLGNGVVPQQAVLALALLENGAALS